MWVEDGEKFAFVGLNVKTEGLPPFEPFPPHFWIFTEKTFKVPSHWREWIGSIRADEIRGCNLFLLSKLAASKPEVLDSESQELFRRASHFYSGLLLASPFSPGHKPIMLTGYRHEEGIEIRQQQDFERPVQGLVRFYPAVSSADIQLAARLAENIELLTAVALSDRWRLSQAISIYLRARSNNDILERIHQYCRCIEGFILPDKGDTTKRFKSRTEIFIGPHLHDMMGNIYEIRCDVEHLHEDKYRQVYHRETMLDIVRKEAVIEYIVRTALARILGDKGLWTHFGNTSGLAKYWVMEKAAQMALWGQPVNPLAALDGFEEKYINDGALRQI